MRGAPLRLRCEYLDNPIGIDTLRPRLSWWLNDPRPAELQSAYQIEAAATLAGLDSGAADLWDTGYLPSQHTMNVEYAGRSLQSGSRVWWRVRCYDSDGTPSAWSEPAWFELGLLDAADWQANWIASPMSGSPLTSVPAPLLWRDFELTEAPASARLYLAALGSAWVELNGRPVSDETPVGMWDDFRRRVPYRVYDVTNLLASGLNRLGVLLGDGFYCGHIGDGPRQRFGLRPAIRAQLVLESATGGRRIIGTDRSWSWHPSWVLRPDRDRGEEIDGRQYQADWSVPTGSREGYPVIEESAVDVECCWQHTPPAKIQAEHTAAGGRRRERCADGQVRIRYDFGRSLLGRARITLQAPPGTCLTVRYGDAAPALPAPGAVGPEPLWEDAADRYTAHGQGTERFEPRFAVHAFRYLEVTSSLEPHQLEEVVALQLGTTAESTAGFQCDHALLEQLFDVSQRTYRMGLALGPVSGLAPARRWALAADSEAILAGASACLDVGALYRAWILALCDSQGEGGEIPGRLPAVQGMVQGIPDGDCEATEVESLLPCLWYVYRCFGDRRLLEQVFPAVQRYLAGLRERWPELVRGAAEGADAVRDQLLGTAWYCYALTLATRMAGVLGRLGDLEAYEALTQRVREAFRARFVTPDGLLAGDHQLGYVLALALGLVEGEKRATALARLESQLRESSYHPAVDLRYGSLLLEVLTLEGRADLAYMTLLQTTAPGWLHPLRAGASILWDPSGDHAGRLALGCAAGWLQRSLLGLDLDGNLTPDLNAYRRMRIQPRPPLGPEFAAGCPVRSAKGHLDTVHGRYECAWQIIDDGFHLRVCVPGNCSAWVIMPDGTESLVVAGEHSFAMRFDTDAIPGPLAAHDEVPVLKEISGASGAS